MVFHIAAQTKTITMSNLEMYSFPMAGYFSKLPQILGFRTSQVYSLLVWISEVRNGFHPATNQGIGRAVLPLVALERICVLAFSHF